MEETQENIKIKIAISLNLLLCDSKKSIKSTKTGEELNTSYSEIADNSNIRKATVSDIFNAKKPDFRLQLGKITASSGNR